MQYIHRHTKTGVINKKNKGDKSVCWLEEEFNVNVK